MKNDNKQKKPGRPITGNPAFLSQANYIEKFNRYPVNPV